MILATYLFILITTSRLIKCHRQDRKDVYDFVVKELTENVDKLSETKGGVYYGRFNKWAGYALLAKVYLNAEVYTGTPKWTGMPCRL
jgi:hypothetical protein